MLNHRCLKGENVQTLPCLNTNKLTCSPARRLSAPFPKDCNAAAGAGSDPATEKTREEENIPLFLSCCVSMIQQLALFKKKF